MAEQLRVLLLAISGVSGTELGKVSRAHQVLKVSSSPEVEPAVRGPGSRGCGYPCGGNERASSDLCRRAVAEAGLPPSRGPSAPARLPLGRLRPLPGAWSPAGARPRPPPRHAFVLYIEMAEPEQKNLSRADEEEVEKQDEYEMTGVNTVPSQSALETENLQVLGESGRFLPPEKHSTELDGAHQVTCTFTVSLAVLAEPAGERQERAIDPDKPGKRTQASELRTRPKSQRCYHIEYFLLPDDLVPRKLDLVLVGLVAKLLTRSKSKTIKPWFEKEKMWLSWEHRVVIQVTNEYLIKLRDHKISLRIWDTNGRTSSKSLQSPRDTLSSPQGDAEAVAAVAETVLLQRKVFEEGQPRPSRTEIKAEESEAQEKPSALPVGEEAGLLARARCGGGLSQSPRPEFLQKISELLERMEASLGEAEAEADDVERQRPGTDEPASRDGRRIPLAESSVSASLQLDVMPLLAGERAVVTHLAEGSPEILDAYMTFTVEAPLMSERQRHELNPLVIRIKSATHLPNTPVPIEVLQRVCVPIYCKYKFHHFPAHQTQGGVHGTHVYFKDVNVLLLGTVEPGEVEKYLRGPPVEIEVHDRDRKLAHKRAKPSVLKDEAGEDVGEGSSLGAKPRMSDSCGGKGEWHPHGVAKVSLSELLSGQKRLAVRAPILNCSHPSRGPWIRGGSHRRRGAVRDSASLLEAHYLGAGSLLKVEVEVAVPLKMSAEMAPYAVIIYVFGHKKASLAHELAEAISAINARGLQLQRSLLDWETIAGAASRQKTTPEKVSELDLVSGFHLMDGETHLFVLEGLKDKAIKRFWDRHFERAHRDGEGQLAVLYSSELSFPQRLYSDLESVFYHFRLCKTLSHLGKEALPFLTLSTVAFPEESFQTLSRLIILCQSQSLGAVIHGSLLPSAQMITDFSHQYGVPLTWDGVKEACMQEKETGDKGASGRSSTEEQTAPSSCRSHPSRKRD
ncbi:uncharacterized protein CFAP92 [Melanerpes formicivorus]|uniref:uncharacterized protein CFAP92 n=1 Tax=Melanerpes formicivorus TaxID=211600 RepID=UPI00358E845C